MKFDGNQKPYGILNNIGKAFESLFSKFAEKAFCVFVLNLPIWLASWIAYAT